MKVNEFSTLAPRSRCERCSQAAQHRAAIACKCAPVHAREHARLEARHALQVQARVFAV